MPSSVYSDIWALAAYYSAKIIAKFIIAKDTGLPLQPLSLDIISFGMQLVSTYVWIATMFSEVCATFWGPYAASWGLKRPSEAM